MKNFKVKRASFLAVCCILLTFVICCLTGCHDVKEATRPVIPGETPDASQENRELREVNVVYFDGNPVEAVDKHVTESDLIDALMVKIPDYQKAFADIEIRTEMSRKEELCKTDCVELLIPEIKSTYIPVDAVYINDQLVAYGDKTTLKQVYLEFIESSIHDIAGNKDVENFKGEIKNIKFTEGHIEKASQLLSRKNLLDLFRYCAGLEIQNEKVKEYAGKNDVPQVHVVVTEVKTEKKDAVISYETIFQEDPSMYEGEKVVLKEGIDGLKEVTFKVTYEDGVEIKRMVISEEIKKEPVSAVVKIGALPKGSATGEFQWPTREGYISSYYGERELFGKWDFHHGIDVAVCTGTKLYAGDGGTVIQAGERHNGYGVYVIIDHGNGFTSYYAHMSKVAVEVGDKVNKGDFIGYSGATGNVTGPHVHYELRIDNKPVNPQKYLPDFYDKEN